VRFDGVRVAFRAVVRFAVFFAMAVPWAARCSVIGDVNCGSRADVRLQTHERRARGGRAVGTGLLVQRASGGLADERAEGECPAGAGSRCIPRDRSGFKSPLRGGTWRSIGNG
jgi:hypothetical protein